MLFLILWNVPIPCLVGRGAVSHKQFGFSSYRVNEVEKYQHYPPTPHTGMQKHTTRPPHTHHRQACGSCIYKILTFKNQHKKKSVGFFFFFKNQTLYTEYFTSGLDIITIKSNETATSLNIQAPAVHKHSQHLVASLSKHAISQQAIGKHSRPQSFVYDQRLSQFTLLRMTLSCH